MRTSRITDIKGDTSQTGDTRLSLTCGSAPRPIQLVGPVGARGADMLAGSFSRPVLTSGSTQGVRASTDDDVLRILG